MGLDFLIIPPSIAHWLAQVILFLLGRCISRQCAGVEEDSVWSQVIAQIVLQETLLQLCSGDVHASVRVFNDDSTIHGSSEVGQGCPSRSSPKGTKDGSSAAPGKVAEKIVVPKLCPLCSPPQLTGGTWTSRELLLLLSKHQLTTLALEEKGLKCYYHFLSAFQQTVLCTNYLSHNLSMYYNVFFPERSKHFMSFVQQGEREVGECQAPLQESFS